VDQPSATSDATSSKADEGASTDRCLRHTVGVVRDPVIDASMQAVADARKLNDPAAEARALVTIGSALLRAHRASERAVCELTSFSSLVLRKAGWLGARHRVTGAAV
jgi:hypothetical protein